MELTFNVNLSVTENIDGWRLEVFKQAFSATKKREPDSDDELVAYIRELVEQKAIYNAFEHLDGNEWFRCLQEEAEIQFDSGGDRMVKNLNALLMAQQANGAPAENLALIRNAIEKRRKEVEGGK